MMDKPLVSIVVPVYNTERRMLDQCFNSILKQTYQPIELIIVDDGSQQETHDVLDVFAAKNERITLLHNQNGGASVARNAGIRVAKGVFITFVDADDWIDYDYVEHLMQAFDDKMDIVMCTRYFNYKHETKENHFFDSDLVFTEKNKKDLIYQSIVTGVAGTWCKVYRRSFLDEYGLRYDEKLQRTQDIIFNLYAFQKASKIRYMDVCKYHYRMQNDSVTKKFNPSADVVLHCATNAFVQFVRTYYRHDARIQKGLQRKCLNILNEICKLKLCNAKWNVSKEERYQKIAEICEMPVYRYAISHFDVKEFPSAVGKVRLSFLKSRKYGMLYSLYQLQLFLESRRNYA